MKLNYLENIQMTKRGPKNLTSDTIKEIRCLYSKGDYTQKKLADLFEISQSTVCKIINNEIHKQSSEIKISGEAKVKVGYQHGD